MPRTTAAAELSIVLATHPEAPVDVAPPRDVARLRAAAATLRETDAVAVATEPALDQPSLSPSHTAALLREAGLPVIAELGVRDRNRVALEGELAAFADAGVGAVRVLADAGGGRGTGDLDAEGLAALTERAGLLVLTAPSQPEVSAKPEPEHAARTAPREGGCPKHMAFGPCGGVDPDGSCEISADPCVFLGRRQALPWPGDAVTGGIATAAGREVLDILARRPLVITGFPVRPMDSASIAETAEVLRDAADAALSGDAGSSRTQFPPAYRALRMGEHGMRVWMGFTSRDRNRVAADRELRSLREIGVAAVHCVTGDHTLTGTRPDAAPVFELESTTTLPLAAAHGLLASFAESPAAPPRHLRGGRVGEKQRAGGRLCLTQYCGDASDVAQFIADVRAAGSDAPVLPGVPVVVDRFGAEMLAGFHSAKLPTGYVQALFDAVDVRAAGIRLAIEYARELLALDGVAGVVVAGGAAPGAEADYARALATVAGEIGGGS